MEAEDLCNEVIRAAYGLAKGRPGVMVKVGSVENGTGFDPADVAGAVQTLVRDGRAIAGPGPEQFALSRFGVEVAKSKVEQLAGVVFVDER